MFVASELGSVGQHQSAIELDKKVLKEDLMCKRVWVISIILYDILWNEKERMTENGQLLGKEKMTENLEHCILLSHFCRQPFYEKFYNDKLDQS